MEGLGEEDTRRRDDAYGRPTQEMVGGHPSSASFDVTLNIVDVVSSIDEQSRNDSFPELSGIDNYHDGNNKQYPYYKPKDEESHEYTNESRQSCRSSGTPPTTQPPPSPRSKAASIIRHFRLVILSDIFFIIGSALFLWASLEEYQSENDQDSQSVAGDASSIEDNSVQPQAPTPAPTPEGYHLQLTTSIDTWITQQMILMVCATFCFLQVGIINFVRTPLDKFHFFQILAGLFGLVSAMFWETKDILSTILYFFFVHAMMGQSLMQFHSHYWKMIAPSWSARKERNNNNNDTTTASSPPKRHLSTPRQRQQGHFALHSPLDQGPPGLVEEVTEDAVNRSDSFDSRYNIRKENSDPDDGHNFWIENSFSLEEPQYPSSPDADLPFSGNVDYRAPQGGDRGSRSTEVAGDAEQIMIQQGIQMTTRRQKRDQGDENDATFQYGIAYCVADGIFILVSAVELGRTYWDIMLLSNDDSGNTDNTQNPSLLLLPGILWLVFAIMTLVATILFHRYTLRMQLTEPHH